jgi:hypothetical protein
MMPKLAMSFMSLYKTEAIVLGYVGSELCVFRTLSALIFFPFLFHIAQCQIGHELLLLYEFKLAIGFDLHSTVENCPAML